MTVLGDRAFKEVLRSEGPGSTQLVFLWEKDPRDLFLSVFSLRQGHWAHGEKAAAHQSTGEVSWEMELGGTLIFNF